MPDKEKSIALTMETIKIAKEFPDNYRVQRCAKIAIQVLQENGVDVDEMMNGKWIATTTRL